MAIATKKAPSKKAAKKVVKKVRVKKVKPAEEIVIHEIPVEYIDMRPEPVPEPVPEPEVIHPEYIDGPTVYPEIPRVGFFKAAWTAVVTFLTNPKK